MTDCAITAPGRSTGWPESSGISLPNPRAEPRNPSTPTIAATCIACLRRVIDDDDLAVIAEVGAGEARVEELDGSVRCHSIPALVKRLSMSL